MTTRDCVVHLRRELRDASDYLHFVINWFDPANRGNHATVKAAKERTRRELGEALRYLDSLPNQLTCAAAPTLRAVAAAVGKAREAAAEIDRYGDLRSSSEIRRLIAQLDRGCREAEDLRASFREPSSAPRANSARVNPLAERLIVAAVRLLPPGQRVQYREEFTAELQWLAEDFQRGFWAQLAYARRQARRTWSVRRGCAGEDAKVRLRDR